MRTFLTRHIPRRGVSARKIQGANTMSSIRAFFCAAAGAAFTLTAMAAVPTPSDAAPAKLVAGTLTCKGHGGVGLIVGSQETLHCIFASPSGAHRRRYVATITKVGVDIGIKGESTLVWDVLSSTSDLPGSALEGTYGGVTAGAAVGVGGNAKALVGGSNDSVVLQPVSVQGQTGLNIAVGVAGLTLREG
jgi:hypothetical protein